MVSALTGVKLHDHNCGMKCYRREVFDEVRLYGELHRFVPVLAAARGFRVGEIVVDHRPRQFGRSKYGVSRFVKGFLDLLTVKFLTGFGQRPQHMLGAVGLVSLPARRAGLIGLAVWWSSRASASASRVQLHQRPALFYSLGPMLLGGQLMSIGFLAELFIAYHVPDTTRLLDCRTNPPGDTSQMSNRPAARSTGRAHEPCRPRSAARRSAGACTGC